MSQGKSVWPSAESAVAAILLADLYASARLHFVSRMLAGAMIGAAILMVGAFALLNKQPQFRYILTDTTGVVIPQVALPEPNHDEKYVVDWAVDSITRLYTFDYANYRLQFQDAKKNMTVGGWDTFEKAMDASGNFTAVVSSQFVTTAAPTGPGKIVKTGAITLGGETRYAWKVQFPMVISYRSSRIGESGKPLLSEQNLTMSVTVIRVPEYINPTGLGVRAITAE
jgi:intracellular multiplication protein IcmL